MALLSKTDFETEINIALQRSTGEPITPTEFMVLNGIDDPRRLVGRCWTSLAPGETMIVDKAALDWIGLKGRSKDCKKNFKQLLVKNNIPFQTVTIDDVGGWPEVAREIESIDSHSRYKLSWVVLLGINFKLACLKQHGSRADSIQRFYLEIELLQNAYNTYLNRRMAIKHAQQRAVLEEYLRRAVVDESAKDQQLVAIRVEATVAREAVAQQLVVSEANSSR